VKLLPATARFSDDGKRYADDGKFRLWLDIRLHDRRVERTACVLLMNPSTARVDNGFLVSDPTVTKACGYARRELCDRLIVVNASAIRLTNSKLLHKQPSIVGNPLNDACIREALQVSQVRLAGWGRLHKDLAWRDAELRTLLREIGLPLHALRINQDGSPGHPLYLPALAPLLNFQP
jgi:hypothetical protein